jgi:adhesin/invasin
VGLPAPTLTSLGGTSTTADPVLKWSGVAGATGYYLTLADETDSTTVLNAIAVSGAEYAVTTPLNNGDTYQWSVTAFDSSGDSGAASQPDTFTVAVPVPPATPTPVGSNGAAVLGRTPTFQWSAVSGASGYLIDVTNISTGGQVPAFTATVTGTSYTPSAALTMGDDYEWEVVAFNSAGLYGSFSNPLEFTAGASPSLSSTSVANPTLVVGGTTTVMLTADDNQGNQEASGGLQVDFGLGAGSAGGNFGAVTDNGNGTYTATFTATAAGNVAIAADIDGWAVVSTPPIVTVANGIWTAAGGGTFNWSSGGNWQGNVPNGVGEVAVLGAAVGSGTATITLNTAQTLGGLAFSPGTGGSYVVNGSGGNSLQLAIDFANGASSAWISVAGGSSSISAPVQVDNNVNVTAAGGTSLVISGPISQSGGSQSLTFSGGGRLTLSGTNTYTGGTVVTSGALIATNNKVIEDGSNLYVGADLVSFGAVVPAATSQVSASPAAAPATGAAQAAATASPPAAAASAARATTPFQATSATARTARIAAIDTVFATDSPKRLATGPAWAAAFELPWYQDGSGNKDRPINLAVDAVLARFGE